MAKSRESNDLTETQKTRMRNELRRDVARRRSGYRERALAMFPHICASCSREFSPRNLKELTVHHKDHDHDNNPPDGSNWELLCIYCHDHEHEKAIDSKYIRGRSSTEAVRPGLANPFADLSMDGS